MCIRDRYTLFPEACHPGAAIFARSWKIINVEYCHESSITVPDFPCFYFRMVNRYAGVGEEPDTVQRFSQVKYTAFRILKNEIWLKHFIINIKLSFLKLFGIVSPVPSFHFPCKTIFSSKIPYFIEISNSSRF